MTSKSQILIILNINRSPVAADDPDSGILHTDIGLGETKHDVYIRAYSRHSPMHEDYEMVSVDGVDLPHGIAIWVRVRIVNNGK